MPSPPFQRLPRGLAFTEQSEPIGGCECAGRAIFQACDSELNFVLCVDIPVDELAEELANLDGWAERETGCAAVSVCRGRR